MHIRTFPLILNPKSFIIFFIFRFREDGLVFPGWIHPCDTGRVSFWSNHIIENPTEDMIAGILRTRSLQNRTRNRQGSIKTFRRKSVW